MNLNGDPHAAGHVDPALDEAVLTAEEKGLLFDDDVSPLPSDLGYRGPTACSAAGITYRQLDYWARRCWTATRICCSEMPASSSRLITLSSRMSRNE